MKTVASIFLSRLRAGFLRAGAAPPLVIGAGLLLWFLLSFLDREVKALALLLPPGIAGPARLFAPVLVEETGKFLAILAFARLSGAARRSSPGTPSGAGLGIVAIIIFSAIENLAYQRAFPGGDIFQRLLWSEPVHLVTALAMAAGLSGSPVYADGTGTGRRSRRPGPDSGPLEVGLALTFALAWHFAANLLADAGPGTGMVAFVALVNLAMIVSLSRLYFDRAMRVPAATGPGKTRRPGGSLHG